MNPDCEFEWVVVSWVKNYDHCPEGTHCDPPTIPGFQNGQLAYVVCT